MARKIDRVQLKDPANIYSAGNYIAIESNGRVSATITAGQNVSIAANGLISAPLVAESFHPFLTSLL